MKVKWGGMIKQEDDCLTLPFCMYMYIHVHDSFEIVQGRGHSYWWYYCCLSCHTFHPFYLTHTSTCTHKHIHCTVYMQLTMSCTVSSFLQANKHGKKLYVMDARPKINAYANIVSHFYSMYVCIILYFEITFLNTHNVVKNDPCHPICMYMYMQFHLGLLHVINNMQIAVLNGQVYACTYYMQHVCMYLCRQWEEAMNQMKHIQTWTSVFLTLATSMS